MSHPLKLVLYGFGIWAVPFTVAMGIFAFIPPQTPLFNTIMLLVLTLTACYLSYRFLAQQTGADFGTGLTTGFIWAVIAVVFDVPFFFFVEQMKMTPADYFADIGLSYLVVPLIAASIGAALARK